MKDLIIPHILRDRIIMYTRKHNKELDEQTKKDYVQEILDTYYEVKKKGNSNLQIYSLFFSTLTNYDMFEWIMDRLTNKEENKVKVYDYIHNYAHSRNFELRVKVNMSNILKWRYEQYPQIQEDLNRLIFILTGKTFDKVVKEVEHLTK